MFFYQKYCFANIFSDSDKLLFVSLNGCLVEEFK